MQKTFSDIETENKKLKSSNEEAILLQNARSPEGSKNEDEKEKANSVPFRKLFRFADKLDIFLIVVGCFASIVTGLAFPAMLWIYGELATGFIYYSMLHNRINIVDNSTSLPFNPNDYDDIYDQAKHSALYFCMLGVGAMVFWYIQYICWDISQERQMKVLRETFFRSIVHHDVTWYDLHHKTDLATNSRESMDAISAAIGKEVSVFIHWTFMWVGAHIVALIKGWKIALACMSFTPLIIIIAAVTIRKIKNVSIKETKAYDIAGGIVEEVLSNIKTVMAFNAQEKESQRYDRVLKEGANYAVGKGFALGNGIGIIWLIIYMILSTAFAYGTKLYRDGEPGLEPGNVLIIFVCVMVGAGSLGQAFPHLETFGNGKAAAVKIFQIIDYKPGIDSSSEHGRKPEAVNGAFELRNVSFSYPSRPSVKMTFTHLQSYLKATHMHCMKKKLKIDTANGPLGISVLTGSKFWPKTMLGSVLKQFNISVEPGETVALVGTSGSGKTTVVQLLERFYDVDIGEVMVDGLNVKGLNVSWLRKQIGYVSQDTVLFGSSIKENIQHGNGNMSDEQITDAARKANIHDFISSLPEGYSSLVGERGTQLSGGQKQRIAIARALVRDPKILLLDEATSSLDNENEAIVQKAIEKAKEGRTTVIVAHRLSTIQHANRIFVLEDGRVLEKGTHNELMDKNGLYHKLVKHQVERGSNDEVVQEIGETLFDSEEENKSPLFYRTLAKPIKLGSAVHVGSKQSLVKEETDEILTHFSIKRLLKLNSPEWHLIAIGCLFSICAGVLQPVLAVVLSEFLNVFTKPVDEQERMTWILVGVILGTGFVVSLMRICLNITNESQEVIPFPGDDHKASTKRDRKNINYPTKKHRLRTAACFSKAGHHLTLRMRSLVFKSFLNQDMTFFDDSKNCVNILATRLATDAATVHGAAGSKIGHTLESVSVLLSALIVAFTASWKLTLVIVSFLPFMIGMGIVVGKMFIGFSKKESAKMEQAGQICSEVIDNIRMVASLTQESSFKNKYGELTDNIYRKAIRRIVLTSLFLALSSSVVYFTLASTFTFGAYLVQHNGLRFHLVFRVFAAISYGGIHIGRTNSIAPDFTKAKLAAARLFSYIDTKPKIDVSATDGSLTEKFDGCIEFQSVIFHYPSRPGVTVLQDMSFTVSPGETLALIGSSGCGKTTTISLIERFYDPVSGRVLTNGEDTKLVNLKWLRSQIGLVDQEPALFDRCITENIAYGDNTRDVPMEEIIEAARNANIHNFISSLPQGYETIVGSKGTQLSGGQKQRIAIARALVASPKILLLDEATSSLDSQNEKIVQRALSHVMKDKTCIVIAHRLSTIRKADKIAIIHKGGIVEQGTHSELLAKQGIYHKLVRQHEH